MASTPLHRLRRVFAWSTLTVGLALAGATVLPFVQQGSSVQARLLKPQQEELPWKSLSPAEVESGAIIPASTHVVFHLPDTFESIPRETLLGHKGASTRYWGYCFPQNYDPQSVDRRVGFQGLLFLSEKERAVRDAEAKKRAPVFNPFTPPTDSAIENKNNPQRPVIRHQLEIFRPRTLCYVMAEESLAIGMDHDADRLNAKLEREIGTDATMADTDQDGISDGVEYFTGTDPLLRDSDSDNVLDGIEDSNWNGRVDKDETDPRKIDSDRDELCDGFCRVQVQNQWIFMGEDKNLNGIVDSGETDPLLWASGTDGVGDKLKVLQCLATGKNSQQCP